MKKMNCYGIDLGTTNSCVTIINNDGKPEIVKNANGQDLTPSVVCYPQGKDSVIVGQAAKNGRLFREKTTVSWIKREIGKEFGAQTPFPRNLTPVQISADILKKLVADANQQTHQEIKDVVITVPAYFNEPECRQTLEAGKLAGLNVLKLVKEPTAAAVAQGLKWQTTTEKYLLVLDLGGGTFDLTLLKVKERNFTVLLTDGERCLGGHDWDMVFAQELVKRHSQRNQSGKKLDFNDRLLKISFLKIAEEAKEQLSEAEEWEVFTEWEGIGIAHTITRDEFESLTKPLVDRVFTRVKKVLDLARSKFRLNVADIDFYLVGGSTKMPCIRRELENILSKYYSCPNPKIYASDVDFCVAKGAAILADEIINETNNIHFTDVTSKSYGFYCHSKEKDKYIVANIIKANTSLPAHGEESFATMVDNQKQIRIQIYESTSMKDEILPNEARLISSNYYLNIVGNHPKETEFTVSFDLDENGILNFHCSAIGGLPVDGQVQTD